MQFIRFLQEDILQNDTIVEQLLNNTLNNNNNSNITDNDQISWDNGTFMPLPIPIPEPTHDPDIFFTSILRYEFLVFMAPCYFFILAMAYRWTKISNEPELDHFDDIKFHISYYIKRFISYFMFVTYMLSLILSQFLDPEYYWVAQYKDFSLLYSFAAVSWFLSAKGLEKEHRKDLPQQIYTHRLFWISSFCISLVKVFLNREVFI